MICIFGLTDRCGSSSLGELIFNNMINPGRYLPEPFSRNFDNWGSFYNFPKLPKITINNLKKITDQYDVKLIKTLEFDLSISQNITLLNSLCKNIFLYRSHFIDQFVSHWMSLNFYYKTRKICYSTNVIRNDKEFFTTVRDPIDIDYMVDCFNIIDAKMKTYLNKCNFKSIVSYEYLYVSNFEERKKRFLHMCKETGINLKKDLDFGSLFICKKHNSYHNYETLIPNWKDVLKLKKDLVLSRD